MYEHRRARLIPRRAFLRRVANHFVLALGAVAAALALGVCGYHSIVGLPWIDALLNASMILGGMGPVAELHSTAGKLFASFYALFSGLAFITIAGILFAPVIHRFLHKFHLEAEGNGGGEESPSRDRTGGRGADTSARRRRESVPDR